VNLSNLKKDLISAWNACCAALLLLGKWLLLSLGIGLIVGMVASVFGHVLIRANLLRNTYSWIAFGLPIGGVLIVLLYHLFKDENDRGTNTVILSLRSDTDIPFRMTPLIFLSTAITHLFGGSAGREGAAIQLGGSIANRLGKTAKLNDDDRRILVMCGMSAGFSALFGTPLAAAVFSLEVVSVGIMHYAALVPCVIAAVTANMLAAFLQIPPEVFPVQLVPALDPWLLLRIILLGALLGAVSILFCMILHRMEKFLEGRIKNPYFRIFATAAAILLLCAILRTDDYLGSGMHLIEGIFHHGGEVKPYAFYLKMLFTAMTLGAGFKGGEIVPSLTIGALFGATISAVLGLPMELAAACGMVGVFCGVTNCPITSLLIAIELFGADGMVYYLITIAISYLLSGRYSLYRTQQILESKTNPRLADITIKRMAK